MNLQERIALLARLGEYMLTGGEQWSVARDRATASNGWFIPAFVDLASKGIADDFLKIDTLTHLANVYHLPNKQASPQQVGIVMAGNIPLVGFHDWLCVFLSGHVAVVKPSSKDDVLIRHLVAKLEEWDPRSVGQTIFQPMLKNCDAYIATGSNNSAGYFEYYFKKYPHIIRRNRSSVAILTGQETADQLDRLADDVFLYFGLGCRNVTKLMVPAGYDFVELIAIFRRYDFLADHHKFKNNYDYNLAIHILNNQYYMSTEALLLIENSSIFSPISQLHYEYYEDHAATIASLADHPDLQCLVGNGLMPFGQAQHPEVTDYADGVDTLSFLSKL